MIFPLLFLILFPSLFHIIFTIGLNLLSGIVPKGDTVLRPFDEVFRIEVSAEGFGEEIEIDVVILKHIKEGKLSDGCHDI